MVTLLREAHRILGGIFATAKAALYSAASLSHGVKQGKGSVRNTLKTLSWGRCDGLKPSQVCVKIGRFLITCVEIRIVFGWLYKIGQNSRFTMCTKELLWHLESCDQLKLAITLALATKFRIEMFSDPPYSDMLNQPFNFSRDELYKFYWEIEGLYHTSRDYIPVLKDRGRNFGVPLPDFIEQHMITCNYALSVWMVTLGAGMNPGVKVDARKCWKYLSDSSSLINEAINELIELENKASSIFGSSDEMGMKQTDRNTWVSAAYFIPECFQTEKIYR